MSCSGCSYTTSNVGIGISNPTGVLKMREKSVTMNLNKIDGVFFRKNTKSKVVNALEYA